MDANEEKVTPLQALSHSKFGIAAFIIGLISLCILVSYLGLIFIGIQYHTSIFIASVMPTVIDFIYAIFVVGSLLTLISFILGLVALFQKNQKKLFAVLAIIQLLFEVCLLLVLSLYMVILLTGAGA
jgi:hypothetical protein